MVLVLIEWLKGLLSASWNQRNTKEKQIIMGVASIEFRQPIEINYGKKMRERKRALFSCIWIAFWPQTPNGRAYSASASPKLLKLLDYFLWVTSGKIIWALSFPAEAAVQANEIYSVDFCSVVLPKHLRYIWPMFVWKFMFLKLLYKSLDH